LSTHALRTSDGRGGLALLRNLDLGVLALALPVFLVADLPLLGYAAVAVVWVLQRGISELATRRAVELGDRRAALGVMAGSLISRIWLVGLAVLAAGLAEREAGVAAGLLAVAVFTVHLSATLMVKPLEEAARR
jgi:hypothetical protein